VKEIFVEKSIRIDSPQPGTTIVFPPTIDHWFIFAVVTIQNLTNLAAYLLDEESTTIYKGDPQVSFPTLQGFVFDVPARDATYALIVIEPNGRILTRNLIESISFKAVCQKAAAAPVAAGALPKRQSPTIIAPPAPPGSVCPNFPAYGLLGDAGSVVPTLTPPVGTASPAAPTPAPNPPTGYWGFIYSGATPAMNPYTLTVQDPKDSSLSATKNVVVGTC
jgi:hypothetical protein